MAPEGVAGATDAGLATGSSALGSGRWARLRFGRVARDPTMLRALAQSPPDRKNMKFENIPFGSQSTTYIKMIVDVPSSRN